MLRSIAILAVLASFAFAAAGQTDRRVERIREVAREADRLVAAADGEGDTASVFVTELLVNRNDAPYPAVGTFGVKLRFYYTYGDRERNPYPDRLVKAIAETRRAARVEKAEFLFDSAGRLIFYFSDDGEKRIRIYFETERAFRAQADDRVVDVRTMAADAQKALAGKRRLARMFADSLAF
jgi:hypothetical protein